MATLKTIRTQIYESLRDAITDVVLADSSWGVTDRNVISEPSEVPQDEDLISIRLITYNARVDLQPFQFGGQDGDPADPNDPPTQWDLTHVQSLVRIQSHGAKAFTWLDVFLHALEDTVVLEHFRDRGFAVESDGAGIADISAQMGAREQTRGTAQVTVSCRVIRKRVTTNASTIRFEFTLDDSASRVVTASVE